MAKRDPYKYDRNTWSYQVVGQTAFPIDMLRFDGAYPARGVDAAAIERTLQQRPVRGNPIVIQLRSNTHSPTADRWRSFGWLVEEVG